MIFSNNAQPRAPRFYAALIFIIALVYLGGGIELARLGGSLYYAATGIILILSAIFLWRGSKWGSILYLIMLLGTLVWAISEAGLDAWALMPRLLVPAIIGLWLLMPHVRRGLN